MANYPKPLRKASKREAVKSKKTLTKIWVRIDNLDGPSKSGLINWVDGMIGSILGITILNPNQK
jgi:hypothetical protein